MEVSGPDGLVLRLRTGKTGLGLKLAIVENVAADVQLQLRAIKAALESLLADDPSIAHITLTGDEWTPVAETLTRRGLAVVGAESLDVIPEMFWQAASDLWLPRHISTSEFPRYPIMTGPRRHPRRAPKLSGVVYSRYVPWLNQVFSLRTINIDADLKLFNRWMNDPRVAYFFEEEGDLGKHRDYLEKIAADPHMTTLLGCLDCVPFCYFEVYWAKENRLGPYYDTEDYDRGWHVAVGEDGYRGRDYVATWLPSLMHYMFLDDARTQRIVGEPRADHHQQIRNLNRSGFASIKEFDFPHKRAMLVMLLRERYFGERLWMPRGASASPQAETGGNGANRKNNLTRTLAQTGEVA